MNAQEFGLSVLEYFISNIPTIATMVIMLVSNLKKIEKKVSSFDIKVLKSEGNIIEKVESKVNDVLAVAVDYMPRDGEIGNFTDNFKIIESSSLPLFSSSTTLWNGVYSYQLIGFNFDDFNETIIGKSFMHSCYSFNQPLEIPSSVTNITDSFMQNCYSFNQPLTIPSSVTSIGVSFMQNCYSLTTLIYNSATFPSGNNSLSQSINDKPSTNGKGIKVFGTQRLGLINALPDRTSSPFRKLVNGGAD